MFGNVWSSEGANIALGANIAPYCRREQHLPPNKEKINIYMESSGDRARLLIKMYGPKRISTESGTDHNRWKSLSKGAVRISTEEIDVLVKIYPQYALWLASGKVAPEAGQISPNYNAAE